jgi:hypothetical protein
LILGISFHSFNRRMDSLIISEPIYNWNLHFLPVSQIPIGKKKYLAALLTKHGFPTGFNRNVIMEYLSGNRSPNIGGFQIQAENNLREAVLRQTVRRHFGTEGFSDWQMLYFDSIARLCKQAKITLVVVNTPVHKRYRALVPLEYKNNYYQNMNKLKGMGALIIDLSALPFPDSFYTDFDHIGAKGVMRTTVVLMDSIVRHFRSGGLIRADTVIK